MKILKWLANEFNIVEDSIKLAPLAGDASMRSYYRCIIEGQSYVVMQQAANLAQDSFIQIAKLLRGWGVNAPEIYKIDYEQGLLLLEDLGDDLYLSELNNKTADQLYQCAIDELLVMQQHQEAEIFSTVQLAKMDSDYITSKLAVFEEWFLDEYLGLGTAKAKGKNTKLKDLLAKLGDLFVEVYAQQPQVFVHLDYHSKNLLVLPASAEQKANKLGVIDFQDAMLGPASYDLVSLLQDAYITWPRAQVLQWIEYYKQQAIAKGVISKEQVKGFVKAFDLVGVHRHLKNLGVFARLYHRDAKPQYLQHMPTLIDYIMQACDAYPELNFVQQFFKDEVIPKLKSMAIGFEHKKTAKPVKKAMILAAGKGVRMLPLTLNTPKPLLKVKGEPLIVHTIKALRKAGIKEIVINLHHRGQQLKDYLGNGEDYGVNIVYSEEQELLDTGGGVKQALPLLGADPFLVVSGDIFTEFPFTKFLQQDFSSLAHLVMVDNTYYHQTGDFELKDGFLNIDGANKLTYGNIGIFDPALFAGVAAKAFPLSVVLKQAIKQKRVTGEHYTGAWYNVGTLQELKKIVC